LDPDALVSTVRRALDEVGVVVVRSGATRTQFFALASRLGVVISELAVFVDPNQPQYVRNPAPVPFHSDHHPLADLIGWYCVRPCQSGGPSVFLDARDAYERLKPADRDRLRSLRLRVKGGGASSTIPVVSFVGDRPRFAWNSIWLEKPIASEAAVALRRFAKLVSGGGDARTVTVPLAPGELVLIDNKRFLHGRAHRPPHSPRPPYPGVL